MVSRQETSRPLLTPGEVMQLPPADELVLVSGSPPFRARKTRYYEDQQLGNVFFLRPSSRQNQERPWPPLRPNRHVGLETD